MATSPATVESVLDSLRSKRFTAKAMFGEYALYADGKVVALICDDRLYVKIHPATAGLAGDCELGPPYPGAKDHYLLGEGEWAARRDLPELLTTLAKQLPMPKPKKPKAAKSAPPSKKAR